MTYLVETRHWKRLPALADVPEARHNNRHRGGHQYRFPGEEERSLMLRKGIYPYEYLTDMDKFKETW